MKKKTIDFIHSNIVKLNSLGVYDDSNGENTRNVMSKITKFAVDELGTSIEEFNNMVKNAKVPHSLVECLSRKEVDMCVGIVKFMEHTLTYAEV